MFSTTLGCGEEEEDYCDPMGCDDRADCEGPCFFKERFSECPNLEQECEQSRRRAINGNIASVKQKIRECRRFVEKFLCPHSETINLKKRLRELEKEKIELEREIENKRKKKNASNG